MTSSLALALFALLVSAPAFAGTCDGDDVNAIVAEVAQTREQAPILDSFPGDTHDVSHGRCEEAAVERVKSGKTDEWLLCYDRAPTFKSFVTDLRSLDAKAAQGLCDRINECLYELFDKQTSPESERLSAAWDSLSCVGE